MKPATKGNGSRSSQDDAYGFAPIAGASARVLVLGTMPGKASLQAGQYYAHPRNAFWPIMGCLVGAGPELDYPLRVAVLERRGIAVWDVLASCRRIGSLDAAIDPGSVVINDFSAFLVVHSGLRRLLFNGAAAEQLFRRYVIPLMSGPIPNLQRLPSTSPAHAGMRFDAKLESWRRALFDGLDPD